MVGTTSLKERTARQENLNSGLLQRKEASCNECLSFWTTRKVIRDDRSANDLTKSNVKSLSWAKMQSKGLQNCQFWRPEDCIFPRDPEEKGGFLTLYPGFAGSETGSRASLEYCFSRYPGLSPTGCDLDRTVF